MRVRIRSGLASGKIGKVMLLGVVTVAMVIPGSDVALGQSGTGSQAALLVTSVGTSQLLQYDGTNGTFQGIFAKNVRGGFAYGPNGDLFALIGNQDVEEYDGATGAFKKIFVTPGPEVDGSTPRNLAFGPNGDLYLITAGGAVVGAVLEYDGKTGAFKKTIAAYPRPQWTAGGESLVFGPNGNLFFIGKTCLDTNCINYATGVLEFDGATGGFLKVFSPVFHGFEQAAPGGIAFGPNGDLFVGGIKCLDSNCVNYAEGVLEYDGTTGAFKSVFVAVPSGGLQSSPPNIVFGPNGDLFVATPDTNQVLEYNGQTGAFVKVFVQAGAGGLASPQFLAFGRTSVAVIVLPGIAGSWTPAAASILNLSPLVGKIVSSPTLVDELTTMIANHLDPSELEALANYKTLVSKLQAQGIPTIILPYDWANGGLQAAARDLDALILARGFKQVDIIAHSLGGLVAQQYIQNRLNNGQSPNVRNLLMLGTPNRGAVLAHCFLYVSVSCVYHAEYGSDQVDRLVAAAIFLLTKTGLFNPASIETIGDLMPTFPYLVNIRSPTSQFISHPTTTCGHVGCLWDNTLTRNLTAWTVGRLNSGAFQSAGIKVYTANGTNLYTARTLSVAPSTPTKARLSHLSVFGDGIVLNQSSTLNANGVTNFFPIVGATHGGSLVDCGADVYLSIVNNTSFLCTPLPFHHGVTIVTHSPVKILLTDPLGRTIGFDFHAGVNVANIPSSLLLDGDSPGIFITDGIPGAYQLDVVGTGTGGAFGLDIAFPNGFPNAFDTTVQEFSGTILPGQKLHFTLDTFAFQGVSHPFAAFSANLEINSPSQAFEVDGRFTLGAGGTFSPVTQPLTIELGRGFLLTIPAGSFTQTWGGAFFFEGIIHGVPLEAYLTPLGGNTYGFEIEGAGAPNLPSANPVDVRLAIGNNGGSVSVNADF